MTLSPSNGKLFARRGEVPARVLIVDDEPLVCWALSAGLRAAGFDAVAATDAATAMALAAVRPPPAVILVDVALRGAEGPRLRARLRAAVPAACMVPMALRDQEVPREASATADVIRKPFDLSDVVRRVCAITGRTVPDDDRMALMERSPR